MSLTSLSTRCPEYFCFNNNYPCNRQQWENLKSHHWHCLPSAASLQNYCSPPSLQCSPFTPDLWGPGCSALEVLKYLLSPPFQIQPASPSSGFLHPHPIIVTFPTLYSCNAVSESWSFPSSETCSKLTSFSKFFSTKLTLLKSLIISCLYDPR